MKDQKNEMRYWRKSIALPTKNILHIRIIWFFRPWASLHIGAGIPDVEQGDDGTIVDIS